MTTNSPSYNDRLLETRPENLLLEPNCVKELSLSFKPLVEDVRKKVKVSREEGERESGVESNMKMNTNFIVLLLLDNHNVSYSFLL